MSKVKGQLRFVSALMVVLLILSLCPLSAQAVADQAPAPIEAETTVSVRSEEVAESFRIVSQTEDFPISYKDVAGRYIEVATSGSVGEVHYVWTRIKLPMPQELSLIAFSSSIPEFVSPDSPRCSIADLFAEGMYRYTVVATDSAGAMASATISVVVSSDYSSDLIADTDAGIEFDGYWHKKATLMVDPLSTESNAYRTLETIAGARPILSSHYIHFEGDTLGMPVFIGQAVISIPYRPSSSYIFPLAALNVEALFVDEQGNPSKLLGTYENGMATFTVKSLGVFAVLGDKTASHTIEASATLGGQIDPSGTIEVQAGKSKTFAFLPDAGYKLAKVEVDGVIVNMTGNTYTFPPLEADHVLRATFEKVPITNATHALTIACYPHGSAIPEGTMLLQHGTVQRITFAPDAGYIVDTVSVNGVPVFVLGDTYLVAALEADTIVSITFKQGFPVPVITHTVTATTTQGGFASPTQATVPHGSPVSVSLVPEAGYQVEEVALDGASLGALSSYEFPAVLSDHTLDAQFEKSPEPVSVYYAIQASCEGDGTISPAGGVSVLAGASQTFSFIPGVGQEVSRVDVDGVTIASKPTSYTFSDVSQDHAVTVYFSSSKSFLLSTGDLAPTVVMVLVALCLSAALVCLLTLRRTRFTIKEDKPHGKDKL